MKLVCLDRDGTINVDVGYLGRDPRWKEQLSIYPDIAEGIKMLNEHDIPVVVITNQSGVARGYFSIERVASVNEEMDRQLKIQGAKIQAWFFCPFVDRELMQKFDIPLTWLDTENMRKPHIGMVRLAQEKLELNDPDIIFIGDKVADVKTGLNAGGRGILIRRSHNDDEVEKAEQLEGDVMIADSFLDAVKAVF